jgi:hypothetical protein
MSEGKGQKVVDRLVQMHALSGMAPLDGVVAMTIAKQPSMDGCRVMATYQRATDGTLVKHYGALGKDTSHEPQIAMDSDGKYAAQPDDFEGVPKTQEADPMWHIYLHPVNTDTEDTPAAVQSKTHRYKGSAIGAEKFAAWIWTFEKAFSKYSLKSVHKRPNDKHEIDVHFTKHS